MHKLLPALFLCGMVLATLIACSPHLLKVPMKDSAVFQYVGQQLLRGEIPYRDIWDHKPPVIYFINAIGAFLSPHSGWGIWLLQYIAVLSAAGVGFVTLQHLFMKHVAYIGTFLWLCSFAIVLNGGNYTEEFALPLQFLLYYLFYAWGKRQKQAYLWLIGIDGALTLALRPNSGALFGVLLVLLLYKGWQTKKIRDMLARLLPIFFGGLLVGIPLVSFFAWQGALPFLYDQLVTYNLAYSHPTLFTRLVFILFSLPLLLFMYLVALPGWWLAGKRLLKHSGSLASPLRDILLLSVIAFPLELFANSQIGFVYNHYYLSLLPALTFLAGYGLTLHKPTGKASYLPILVMVLAGSFALQSVYFQLRETQREDTYYNGILSIIRQQSQPSDTLLVWGGAVQLNVGSARTSPTKYIYQYSLTTPGYMHSSLQTAILHDIATNQPRLIIDTHDGVLSFTPTNGIRNTQVVPDLTKLLSYIHSHYVVIYDDKRSTIYKRNL